MGIAAVLLFVVVVDTVLTAFLMGRWRGVREELRVMSDAFTAIGARLRDAGNSDSVAPISSGGVDANAVADAKAVLASASPEDIAQARTILEQLGL